jgi:hypothetical protein
MFFWNALNEVLQFFYTISAFPGISSRKIALETAKGIKLSKWLKRRKETSYDIP